MLPPRAGLYPSNVCPATDLPNQGHRLFHAAGRAKGAKGGIARSCFHENLNAQFLDLTAVDVAPGRLPSRSGWGTTRFHTTRPAEAPPGLPVAGVVSGATLVGPHSHPPAKSTSAIDRPNPERRGR